MIKIEVPIGHILIQSAIEVPSDLTFVENEDAEDVEFEAWVPGPGYTRYFVLSRTGPDETPWVLNGSIL
jgi:hypothetical protein